MDQLDTLQALNRNYIRSVYEKLHDHSKSEAVGRALRGGLLR